MSATTTDHPAPAPAGIEPADLATFRKTSDGNLIAKVERFGRLTIEFGDAPFFLEISRARSTVGDRPFQVYVYAGFSGTAEQTLEAKRENNGFTPGAMHVLTKNGQLRVLEGASPSKKDRHAATGHTAAEADAHATQQTHETAQSQQADATDDNHSEQPAAEPATPDDASVGAAVHADGSEPATSGADDAVANDGGDDE